MASLSKMQLKVRYTPSSIGVKQQCLITLFNEKISEWAYEVEAMGTEPVVQEKSDIYGLLNQNCSTTISFQNPFNANLLIKAELKSTQGDQKTWHMLFDKHKHHKKTQRLHFRANDEAPWQSSTLTESDSDPVLQVSSTELGPKESISIPILFSPQLMKRYESTLFISSLYNNQTLIWTYPIVGLAQCKLTRLLELKCAAREAVQEVWDIHLENQIWNEKDKFDVHFNYNDQSMSGKRDNMAVSLNKDLESLKTLVNSSFEMELIDNCKESSKNQLQIRVLFSPLRPFSYAGELLIVNKTTGVQWLLGVRIEALEPVVDDVIRIESPLNQSSSIGFQLLNLFNCEAPFTAFFTPDSPDEFRIYPSKGVLQAATNDQGTTFIISFTPHQYGAPLVGKLLIQTQVMQWGYKVIGTHPKYKPPLSSVMHTKIDSHISKQVLQHKKCRMLQVKNFVKENAQLFKLKNKRFFP
ncbi:hypothetical protein RFI_08439 [Reticulomyxa filosa]|uniref:CFAP47-like immunoglobulin-like domain-containing protein n=1 Tax=Reticulomyxa filosa TaxID=46433 RepID=X6NTS2_RETFI|nr:hypothetical protein RFI_08439 [Reticulomyxa filosa]|eukprot:ETO28692.1 hypothetical protein RFI_08439 [Reticulomyxa filosa]